MCRPDTWFLTTKCILHSDTMHEHTCTQAKEEIRDVDVDGDFEVNLPEYLQMRRAGQDFNMRDWAVEQARKERLLCQQASNGGVSDAKDGALTAAFVDEFRAIDANEDGHISVDELARYFGISHEQVCIVYDWRGLYMARY